MRTCVLCGELEQNRIADPWNVPLFPPTTLSRYRRSAGLSAAGCCSSPRIISFRSAHYQVVCSKK